MFEIIVHYLIALIIGLLLGNFATVLFYRLPRNVVLYGFRCASGQPPFCSKCHHILKFYEYLPLLSWFSAFGTCNYCDQKITPFYTVLEIIGAFLSIICLYIFDFGDLYILMLVLGILSFLMIFLHWEQNKVFNSLTIALTVWGMIFRTLMDLEIIAWLLSLSVAGIISILLMQFFDMKKAKKSGEQHEVFILISLIMPASVWCFDFVSATIFIFIFTFIYTFTKLLKRSDLLYSLTVLGLFVIVFLRSSYILMQAV